MGWQRAFRDDRRLLAGEQANKDEPATEREIHGSLLVTLNTKRRRVGWESTARPTLLLDPSHSSYRPRPTFRNTLCSRSGPTEMISAGAPTRVSMAARYSRAAGGKSS